MTTPSDPENGKADEGVNLGKDDQSSEAPFDPYRFGKPDHPIPAEYAPPGYTGPVIPSPPYQQPQNPWQPGPQGPPPSNPFSNPPGVPYGAPPPHQPPYPPMHYGPPPPQYHGYAPPPTGNGKAVAALVLGIASIVFCWLSVFDGIFVVLGIVFAAMAISETKTPGRRGRGMAVAGLICAIVGALLATLLTVLIVHAVNQCGGFNNTNSSSFDQCVQDHIG
jgi:Domain of unknown function (DUF4190)